MKAVVYKQYLLGQGRVGKLGASPASVGVEAGQSQDAGAAYTGVKTQCHLVEGRCWGAEVTGVEHEAISAVEDYARAGKLDFSGNSARCRICHPQA